MRPTLLSGLCHYFRQYLQIDSNGNAAWAPSNSEFRTPYLWATLLKINHLNIRIIYTYIYISFIDTRENELTHVLKISTSNHRLLYKQTNKQTSQSDVCNLTSHQNTSLDNSFPFSSLRRLFPSLLSFVFFFPLEKFRPLEARLQ
jgi:hypothetical protein